MNITQQEAAALIAALSFAESEGQLAKAGYEMIVKIMDAFPSLKNRNLYEGCQIAIEHLNTLGKPS